MTTIRTRRKYRSLFHGQLLTARQRGFRVKQVPSKVTRDYIGMNSEAAKALGFPMPPRTIYIDKDLTEETKYHTLKHELIEADLMRKGMKYWPAHKIALKRERG